MIYPDIADYRQQQELEEQAQFNRRERMAKVSEMIESKYLKQADIEDDTLVTIEKVGKANVAKEGDEPEHKWLIKFAEFPKLMVLNATNIKRLARACGDDTDDWKGKQVVLYVDPDVEFAGQVVGGLRVRQYKAPSAKTTTVEHSGRRGNFEDIDSDVPFAPIGKFISGHAI